MQVDNDPLFVCTYYYLRGWSPVRLSAAERAMYMRPV